MHKHTTAVTTTGVYVCVCVCVCAAAAAATLLTQTLHQRVTNGAVKNEMNVGVMVRAFLFWVARAWGNTACPCPWIKISVPSSPSSSSKREDDMPKSCVNLLLLFFLRGPLETAAQVH